MANHAISKTMSTTAWVCKDCSWFTMSSTNAIVHPGCEVMHHSSFSHCRWLGRSFDHPRLCWIQCSRCLQICNSHSLYRYSLVCMYSMMQILNIWLGEWHYKQTIRCCELIPWHFCFTACMCCQYQQMHQVVMFYRCIPREAALDQLRSSFFTAVSDFFLALEHVMLLDQTPRYPYPEIISKSLTQWFSKRSCYQLSSMGWIDDREHGGILCRVQEQLTMMHFSCSATISWSTRTWKCGYLRYVPPDGCSRAIAQAYCSHDEGVHIYEYLRMVTVIVNIRPLFIYRLTDSFAHYVHSYGASITEYH